MLTRLRVSGFKNLDNVDLSFGPFSCIAGPNGVGKSNLFDAISLLSDLSHRTVIEAMTSVRGTNGRISEVGRLFTSTKDGPIPAMLFVADMVVPRSVRDDYDRPETATATFLEYTLELRFNANRTDSANAGPVYIEREELRAKPSSDAAKSLPFNPGKAWIKKYVFGPGPRKNPFISTVQGLNAEPTIRLLGDKSPGRPIGVPARKSPQTVLSGVNEATSPTALTVRNELRSWRLLQLEPSALRRPDELRSQSQVSAIGAHLPAALLRIGSNAEVAQRLADLIPGVISVDVATDSVRETKTLEVRLRDKKAYSASSLSDGTLRFLALAILASDPDAGGLICMEEPENGIHPLRIPDMLKLVRALADVDEAEEQQGGREVLRQVIINTHSPLVVGVLPNDELLMAETLRFRGREFMGFKPLRGTWRAKLAAQGVGDVVSRGELAAYLGESSIATAKSSTKRLVRDDLTPDMFEIR